MKWIFACLVVANGAYFFFQWQDAAAPQPNTSMSYPNASSADGVLLLKERSGNSDRRLEAQIVLQNPIVEKQVVDAPDQALAHAEVSDTEPPVPAHSGPQRSSPELSDPPPSGSKSPPAAEEVAENSLQVSGANEVRPQLVADSGAALESASPVCWRLGAFQALTDTQNVAERISAIGVDVEIKAIDAPTGDFDYRVVIPPMTSMQEAFRRLRELKNRNIDSYVMTQGENAQGISLGLFSTRAAADRHKQAMSGLGYDSVIRTIARVSRGYWIFIEGSALPQSALESVQNRYPEANLTETDCLN